jgi:hypothetical protein
MLVARRRGKKRICSEKDLQGEVVIDKDKKMMTMRV